jgi:pyrrolidone-carboxylate peptidase
MSKFISDRVEKLTELYEKHKPEIKRTWVLPMGETDGRKSIIVEEIVGEDISPFDLPDFKDQMPKLIDYIKEDSNVKS